MMKMKKFLHNDPVLKQRRKGLRRNNTEAEKTFWMHVHNRRFSGRKFYRQYSLGSYILDFYCPELKVAIELDGGQHNQDDNKEYDAARSVYLKAQGIEVMRFWNNDVLNNIEGVLNKLAESVNLLE